MKNCQNIRITEILVTYVLGRIHLDYFQISLEIIVDLKKNPINYDRITSNQHLFIKMCFSIVFVLFKSIDNINLIVIVIAIVLLYDQHIV